MVDVALALTIALLMVTFSQVGDAFFPMYRQLSSGVLSVLSAAFSIVSFSVWPCIAVTLIALFLGLFIRCFVKRSSLVQWFASLVCVALSLSLMFVGIWGLNHYAPPLSQDLGLEVGEYSQEELLDATRHYLNQAAVLADQVPRDQSGSLERQDFGELAAAAGSAYEGLETKYPVFSGSTKPVKELLAGDLLLATGHNGIFVAITGESSVPADTAVGDMPFTMCHEVAHRFGIASEKEANFAAILACASSDDSRFAYAGYLKAFDYCLGALYAYYPQAVSGVMKKDALVAPVESYQLVLDDLQDISAHYQQYEGPLEEVGTSVNDAYLKSFSQESGVRSYGEVVDYLIAWKQD